MAGLADAKREANSILDLETSAAWAEYLSTCRTAVAYEKVEPYAWVKLRARLLQIERRRERLNQ